MALSHDRSRFTLNLTKLLAWGFEKGLFLALDEGRIFQKRPGFFNGVKGIFTDAVHISTSKHYVGLAVDLIMYEPAKDGTLTPVFDGGDKRWKMLGMYWKSIDPNNTWGGDFKKVDSNHFSYGEK